MHRQPCSTHFPFPNQFPTQATTAGQPVVCISPFITCRKVQTSKEKCCETQSGALWLLTFRNKSPTQSVLYNPRRTRAVIWPSCESSDSWRESDWAAVRCLEEGGEKTCRWKTCPRSPGLGIFKEILIYHLCFYRTGYEKMMFVLWRSTDALISDWWIFIIIMVQKEDADDILES